MYESLSEFVVLGHQPIRKDYLEYPKPKNEFKRIGVCEIHQLSLKPRHFRKERQPRFWTTWLATTCHVYPSQQAVTLLLLRLLTRTVPSPHFRQEQLLPKPPPPSPTCLLSPVTSPTSHSQSTGRNNPDAMRFVGLTKLFSTCLLFSNQHVEIEIIGNSQEDRVRVVTKTYHLDDAPDEQRET